MSILRVEGQGREGGEREEEGERKEEAESLLPAGVLVQPSVHAMHGGLHVVEVLGEPLDLLLKLPHLVIVSWRNTQEKTQHV